jgi:hypothetical protein
MIHRLLVAPNGIVPDASGIWGDFFCTKVISFHVEFIQTKLSRRFRQLKDTI